jgi:hypothetical protein
LPWCQVDHERIIASAPLDPREILSASEQTILKVLKEHGPVIQRAKFEELCLAAGMNHGSFWVLLSYCPLICRHATGVYGLRGAEVPVGLIDNLVPKRRGKPKLVVDYAWKNERDIQILYRVSEGMLSRGIVTIPTALKVFLKGRFTLMTDDNSNIGTLVLKDNSAWGLRPFFIRRGGEVGDYLSIVFDLSRIIATVQLGDASLTDKGENPIPISMNDEAENRGHDGHR